MFGAAWTRMGTSSLLANGGDLSDQMGVPMSMHNGAAPGNGSTIVGFAMDMETNLQHGYIVRDRMLEFYDSTPQTNLTAIWNINPQKQFVGTFRQVGEPAAKRHAFLQRLDGSAPITFDFTCQNSAGCAGALRHASRRRSGSIAEFEPARIQERIHPGLARVKAQGKRIGTPQLAPLPMPPAAGLTVREAAAAWGVSSDGGETAPRRTRTGRGTTLPEAAGSPRILLGLSGSWDGRGSAGQSTDCAQLSVWRSARVRFPKRSAPSSRE